jgi:hypothetical protein
MAAPERGNYQRHHYHRGKEDKGELYLSGGITRVELFYFSYFLPHGHIGAFYLSG